MSESISIQELLPQITADVAKQLSASAVERFKYVVSEAVEAEVRRFIAAEIVPKVAADLKEREVEIRGAVLAGIVGACTDAAQAIREAMTKKLSGYEGDKLIGELLRPLIPRGY